MPRLPPSEVANFAEIPDPLELRLEMTQGGEPGPAGVVSSVGSQAGSAAGGISDTTATAEAAATATATAEAEATAEAAVGVDVGVVGLPTDTGAKSDAVAESRDVAEAGPVGAGGSGSGSGSGEAGALWAAGLRGAAAPGPTRPELARRRRTLLLAASVWLLALLVSFGVRPDFGSVDGLQLLWMELAPLLAAGGCVWLALAGGELGLGARPRALLAAGVVAVVVPMALAWGLSSHDSGGLSVQAHAKCFALAFAGALPPLLLLGLWLPHSFVARSRLRSALLGVAAGLGGALLVNLHCAAMWRVHVSFAHHLPMLALSAIGATWLGRKMRV